MVFRGFNGATQESIGKCVLPWKIGGHVEMIDLHVVPGAAGLLLSKPLLKNMRCVLDLEKDELYVGVADARVKLLTARGGHYEVPLDGSSSTPGFQ